MSSDIRLSVSTPVLLIGARHSWGISPTWELRCFDAFEHLGACVGYAEHIGGETAQLYGYGPGYAVSDWRRTFPSVYRQDVLELYLVAVRRMITHGFYAAYEIVSGNRL